MPVFVVFGCQSGFHRADTVSRTLVDVVNGLMIGSIRVADANFFSLIGRKPWTAESKFDDVFERGDCPNAFEDGGPMRRDRRYAYDSTRRNKRSRATTAVANPNFSGELDLIPVELNSESRRD